MEKQPKWLVEMLERRDELKRELEFIQVTEKRWREETAGHMRRANRKQRESPVLKAVLQALPANGDAVDALAIHERVKQFVVGVSWKNPDQVMRELLRRYPGKIERGGRRKYRLAEAHRREMLRDDNEVVDAPES